MSQLVTLQGAADASLVGQINAALQRAMGIFCGNIVYLDPHYGYDGNDGSLPTKAVQTLARGYALLRDGRNDVLVLMQDGTTTATARLSSGFTWAKNAAHLIGTGPLTYFSQRSRIAPTSGITAFANFFTLSGSGCLFEGIQWFHGFGTGTTSQICMTISGNRNVFQSCHLAGMGDDASAQSAGSRSIKFSAGSENVFRNCGVGVDTVTRTQANASVEFASGATRNVFEECVFPFMGSAAGVLGVIVSAAAGSDRFQLFDRCKFINAIKSTSTQMTALSTLAASMGGMHVYKDCTLVGITEFGSDATSLAQIYVDGASVVAATSGIAVNPS